MSPCASLLTGLAITPAPKRNLKTKQNKTNKKPKTTERRNEMPWKLKGGRRKEAKPEPGLKRPLVSRVGSSPQERE